MALSPRPPFELFPLSTLSSNLARLALALTLACALHGSLDLNDLGFLLLELLLDLFDLLLRPLTWWPAVSVASPPKNWEVGWAHISLPINSRRPFTVPSASILSCFSKTGPTSL